VSEKRFDPTPARRDRARREGNVARSRELAGIGAFAAALAASAAALPLIGASAAAALQAAFVSRQPALGASAALVMVAFVPAVAAAGGAVAMTFAQGGIVLAPIAFSLAKLAPLPGLRRAFGGEAVVGAVRATAAFAAVCAAIVPFVLPLLTAAPALGSPRAVARAAADAAVHAGAAACAVGALFAFADYALARRRWLHGLKMSLDELKRDLRENDGDPHAKQRRRHLHRAIARGGIERVREASFVVVNPTHVAVALRYAPPAVPVPEILVRAVDAVALRVRTMAECERIPIVADVALARWLYRTGEAGRPIPAETFVAVAQAVATLVRAGLLDA
jgi:flagellar biosynthesis protein FlhB